MIYEDDWRVRVLEKAVAKLPTYAYVNNSVGDLLGDADAISCDSVGVDVLINPSVWGMSGSGDPLNLAFTGAGKKYWVPRAYLQDPEYMETLKAIRDRAETTKLAMWDAFRDNKFGVHKAGQSVELFFRAPGYRGDKMRTQWLEPGKYETGEIVRKSIRGHRAPYCMEILISTEEQSSLVLVPLDYFAGATDDDASDASTRDAVAVATRHEARVGAQTILDDFDAAFPGKREELLNKNQLTDDAIHYVDEKEMGAVFVLGRLPTNEAEIEDACSKNQDEFMRGTSSPGTRLEGDIYVQKSGLGVGTEYHEALHTMSHKATLAVLGKAFNEGVTEHFTRKLIQQAGKDSQILRDRYPRELEGVELLITQCIIEEEQLWDAYFHGNLRPLFMSFDESPILKKVSLQAYAEQLGENPQDAVEYLLGVLSGSSNR